MLKRAKQFGFSPAAIVSAMRDGIDYTLLAKLVCPELARIYFNDRVFRRAKGWSP